MIVDHIRRNARLFPEKTALLIGAERCSYSELWKRIGQRAKELQLTIRPGQIVPRSARPEIDWWVDYFAIHLIGAVNAPLEKNLPQSAYTAVSNLLISQQTPEGSADILYTTGTTGQSKAVIQSHRAQCANAENLISGQGFQSHLAFVVSGPLNHIGSLSKVHPTLMVGGTVIIVDGLRDLNAFLSALAYPDAPVATFLVPASIRILLQVAHRQLQALSAHIDFIETGAAPISQADMEALCRLLPQSRLYNTYASTETGIISTYNFNGGACIANCLGRPLPHSSFHIHADGRIVCSGDTLMSGYLSDPLRTAEVLSNGTVVTSDLGRIDSDGRLHLTGRENDTINVGGFKVAPSEVENAALSFPSVHDCICIPVPHPITQNALKLLVVTTGQPLDKEALTAHLHARLENYKVPERYEQVESIHRTYNGKLDRRHYAPST